MTNVSWCERQVGDVAGSLAEECWLLRERHDAVLVGLTNNPRLGRNACRVAWNQNHGWKHLEALPLSARNSSGSRLQVLEFYDY